MRFEIFTLPLASLPEELHSHGSATLNTVQQLAGSDLAAPLGTPILAVADGVVTFAGRRGGYDGLIFIEHTVAGARSGRRSRARRAGPVRGPLSRRSATDEWGIAPSGSMQNRL